MINKNDRKNVYWKYEGKCAYCGKPISYSEMEVDHFVPYSVSQDDSIENLMPSCQACNHFKSDKDVKTWKIYINELSIKSDLPAWKDKASKHSVLLKQFARGYLYYEKPKGINIQKKERPETLSHKQMLLIKPSMASKLQKCAFDNSVSFNYLVNVALNEFVEKYGL